MDLFSETKNTGSSAFGSSKSSSSGNGNGASSGNGSTGLFSNFNLQKIVLLLAVIAFIISISTIAILLWKSKSDQKWPPEVSKCPDRWVLNTAGNKCVDPYGLTTIEIEPKENSCEKYTEISNKKYTGANLDGYIPWEGILDGDNTRSLNLKC